VQDEGSQLLAYLVAPKRGQMIADFCAGAGGKTLAIGALMKNTGRLYAFDISEKRLHNLGQRLKRSGLSNLHAQLITGESDQKLKRLNGKFDRVLVDAPCSGLGTLRRNPDLKWRFEAADIAELNVKQSNILARAAKLVKAGGRLIYATCSLLQDENEAIAEAFLTTNGEFTLVPANEVLAQQQIKVDTGKYLKLLPHLHGTDGFFAAVFERKAEVKKSIAALSDTAEGKTTEPEGNIHAAAGASKKKSAKPKAEKPVKLEAVKPKAVKTKVAKDKVVKDKVVKVKVSKE
jgi:16S rRNA (cytosine967-C5)-methyltransferase